VQLLAATLQRMTAPLWHSSQMDRSLCTRSAQARAAVVGLDISDSALGASIPDCSFSTHWGSPQQLVRGSFEGGDTMATMCTERMEGKGEAAGPPVICWQHVQGLGRGQVAGCSAHCTNQAAEVNTRRLKEQGKAEAGIPPVLIQHNTASPPCWIPKLDQQRLISTKASSIFFSLHLIQLTLSPTAVSRTPHAAGIIHQRVQDNATSGASLDFSVGGIYNSTHNACCFLLKPQVPQAGHQCRPIDVHSASSHCSQYLHEEQACSGRDPLPPHLLHRRHHHQQDSLHSMIPQRQSKTRSCRFDRYERTRPTRNTTFLPSFLKMTFFSPLLSRKQREGTERRRTAGRTSGHRRGKE
jgi:hypothetical protein